MVHLVLWQMSTQNKHFKHLKNNLSFLTDGGSRTTSLSERRLLLNVS